MTDRKVRIESVQSIPPEADVCDFDELDEAVGHQLSEHVATQTDDAQLINDQSTVEVLDDCTCDIIKFTDFYRIEPF